MSRISTIYDKTVGKCLIIRGSEAYAHTTDTILQLDSITKDRVDSFNATFTLNVLRDVGDSNIALYDGEELIKVIDWSDSSSTTTVSDIRLEYITQHNIYAKYEGNKQCLPSRSKTIDIAEPIPSGYDGSISFNVPNPSFLSTVTIPFTLNAPDNRQRTVYYYIDGDVNNKQSISVTSNTQSNIVLNDLSNGLHTINVYFGGDNYLTDCSNEIQISKGGIVTVTTPSVLLDGLATFNMKFKCEDYFGNGITAPHTLLFNYDDTLPISFTGFTDGLSIGTELAEISLNVTNVTLTDESVPYLTVPVTVTLEDGSPSTAVVDSFEFDLNITTVTSFSMNVDKPFLVDNETTSISGVVSTANDIVENIPVEIDGTTYYTDANGQYLVEFTMTDLYDMSVTGICGEEEITKTIENVLFYYDRNNWNYNTDTNLNTFIGKSNVTVGSTQSYGLRFSGTATTQSYAIFKASVHKNVRIDFRVTEMNNPAGIKFQDLHSFKDIKLGDNFTFTRTDRFRVAVNGKWLTSYNDDGYSYFTCHFGKNGTTSRLSMNKIKIKRIKVA